MELNEILSRIGSHREIYENSYAAHCPSCKTDDEALNILYDTNDGFTYMRCSNGCTQTQICNALSISESDLYAASASPMSKYFKPLFDFEEQEAKWLIEGWLPEGQITLLAADGGVGKTTLWCDVAAAISSGKQCILDAEGTVREPKKVLVLTTEDSINKKLKAKLKAAGADESNIMALDLQQDRDGEALSSLTFGSKELSSVIRAFHPALCIFDPVQGFIPPDINMGSRNAMRCALAPLIPLGEECGTTFLIICHSNKRKGASGRDRIADSADLWDISRSVMMAGYTQVKGIRYLSNEKNNYAALPDTVLFSINKSGLIEKNGTTDKRDRDYAAAALQYKSEEKSAPQRDDCKRFIIDILKACEGNKIRSSELNNLARDEGYSKGTLQRAKDDLRATGEIFVEREGGKDGAWYVKLGEYFTKAPEWEQAPFDLS